MESKKFVITKKVAKHGSQAIIVIPRILESELKPGTIAQVTIEIIESQGGQNE
ncbi:MAG: hypothetical protein Q8Q31_00510 [Nanoarchaeota archaeon]|nr:hypothetical protein [Nanoarchaeota archaeon]